MIFCHNTYNRPYTVNKTIQTEKNIFPESRHIVVYNNSSIREEDIEADTYYIGKNKGHKLGSINSVFSALSRAYDIAGENEFVVFSHDDVYMSCAGKFNSMLELMEDYDFVGRRYIGTKHSDCDYYIMMESFIIRSSAIPSVVGDYTDNSIETVPLDKMNSECPEMYFGEKIKHLKSKYWDIEENMYGENIMGYNHIKNIRGKGDKL